MSLGSAPWRLALSRFQGVAPDAMRHGDWNIGIVKVPLAELLDPSQAVEPAWLPARRGKYIADPFPFKHQGRWHLFFEEYDFATGLGAIAYSPLGRNFDQFVPRTVLAPPFHISYPQVFSHDGAVFMIPETSVVNEVALYRAAPFPDRWIKVATLLDGVPANDPTLLRHRGLWWLMATVRASFGEKLFAWYSNSLSHGWRAHMQNPIKADLASSRPAGRPFKHRGALYRPAQDCSQTYGARVVINRVLELAPDAFHEEVAGMVEPKPDGNYPTALHTLSAAGEVTFVDGRRWAFLPRVAKRRLVRAMKFFDSQQSPPAQPATTT